MRTFLRAWDGRGQTVKIHEPSRGRKKRSRYTNTRERSLSHAAHANLCSCVSTRPWLVVSAIFSAASPCLRQERCCTLRRIRNVTATENYIPRILNLKRSTRSRQKRYGDFADRFLTEFVRLHRMRDLSKGMWGTFVKTCRYVDYPQARYSSSALYNSNPELSE